MILEVKNINTYYENVHALKDVSLEVNEGEIVALIGSNGAGKTTRSLALSELKSLKAERSSLWTRTSLIPVPTKL